MKRSLTNIGGAVDIGGNEATGKALAYALDVGPDEDAHRAHVHGFHTYAARMHPVTAARLVQSFAPRAARSSIRSAARAPSSCRRCWPVTTRSART